MKKLAMFSLITIMFFTITRATPGAVVSFSVPFGSAVGLGEPVDPGERRAALADPPRRPKTLDDVNEAGGPHTENTNWSGYVVRAADYAVSLVEGEWTVPNLTCGDTDSSSYIFVGIDGSNSHTVEQIGTEQDCQGAVPHYFAWYEMYPAGLIRVGLPVHAGDEMHGTVTYLGKDQFALTLLNMTTGDSFSTRQSHAGARRSSAEWIVEVPGMHRLADFGAIRMYNSQATINGTKGPISSFADYALIDMVDSVGPVKTQTFGLSGGGTDFAVVWYHP